MSRLYKYLCIGRYPDHQGWGKNPRNESEIFRAQCVSKRACPPYFISGETEVQRRMGFAWGHKISQSSDSCPLLFPLTILGLSSWPCFSPRNAAAGLPVSPHSYLLKKFQTMEPCTFKIPPEWRLSFSGSIKSTICEWASYRGLILCASHPHPNLHANLRPEYLGEDSVSSQSVVN